MVSVKEGKRKVKRNTKKVGLVVWLEKKKGKRKKKNEKKIRRVSFRLFKIIKLYTP